jgi:CRISPR/Cas system-associated exonuclease Cas4 (RecB family)
MKMKFISLIFLFFFLIETLYCQEPTWYTTKKHPRYPERLYILGIGAAKKTKDKLEDIKKANDEAFADIAKQIKATIESKSIIEQLEVISGKKVESLEKASANLQVTTQVTIGGLKIVEVYFDKREDIYYSLAVLERETAGGELKDKLLQYFNSYTKSIELARKQIEDKNFYQALLNLSEAYKSLISYNELFPLYRFIIRPLEEISPESWKLSEPILVSEVKSIVQDIFGRIKIEKISGEDQNVLFNQPLKPLILKVYYNQSGLEYPISGFKFKYFLRNGKGKISEHSISDRNGNAKCEIYSLEPYKETFYTIVAKLDLSDFKSEYDDWNDFLVRYESELVFMLKRESLTLDDKIRDAVLNLNSKILDKSAKVMVAGVYYRDKIPSPMASYLREKIERGIEAYTSLVLIGVEQIKLASSKFESITYSRENLSTPEAFGSLIGANVVITGSCWDSDDEIDLILKAIDVQSKIVIATTDVKIPLSMLPKIPIAPENYKPGFDDKILKEENKGKDLQVEVWVDRPDGIYYDGDEIKIFVRATRDCYINLIYHDAKGNTILVFPNKENLNNKIEGNKVYKVPGEYVIKPPFGREILKVVASETPLPMPKGRVVGGLIVIDSIQDYLISTRSIGLKTVNYAEDSIVLTTLPKN